MANLKFSQFVEHSDPANVQFVVGYDGTDNVRIAPTNLAPVTSVNSLTGAVSLGLTDLDDVGSDGTNGQVLTTNGSGSFTFQDAAGGAQSLNDLTDGNTVSGGTTLPGWTESQNLFLGPIAANVPNLDTTNSFGRNVIICPAGDDGPTGLTNGSRNVIIGTKSGSTLIDGESNVVIGNAALSDNFRGTSTVAIGTGALQFNTAQYSTGNTAVGYYAGRNSLSGRYSTFFGWKAGWNSSSNTASGDNVMALGYEAYVSSLTASNEITLGNSSITALRCAVTSITSLSDERDKSDIKDLEYGLAFIDALQPREFVWDNRPEIRIETDDEGNETEVEFYSANKGKKDFGFIAQEVRELDNDTLRLIYAENENKLEMSYGKLVPILVKAVQELKAEVEFLKTRIETLENA